MTTEELNELSDLLHAVELIPVFVGFNDHRENPLESDEGEGEPEEDLEDDEDDFTDDPDDEDDED